MPRETEVLHLSLRSVDEILREQPASWRIFAGLALGKLEVAMWAIDDLMMRDSSQAIRGGAAPSGRMSRRNAPRAAPIAVHVSQDDLAAMANVSRSTANAILRRLEAGGHVEQTLPADRHRSPDALRSMLAE